jgi:ABC-type oligopeptide transport system substrate-binding subunit
VELRVDNYLESIAYVLNVQRPPLDSPEVRQALSLALDRRRISEAILRGGGVAASSYVPPGTGAYHPPAVLEENLAEARRLLAEAGYPNGEGLRPLELILFSGEETERVAAAVQQLWKQGLGIELEINNMERQLYFSQRRERDFDLCFLGWVGDYVDPMTFLGLWHSEAGNNLAGWQDPEYDRLLAEASHSADRMAVLAQAEHRLLSAMPVIPLYFGSSQYLLDPRVQGWHKNLLDLHPLRAVDFEFNPQDN